MKDEVYKDVVMFLLMLFLIRLELFKSLLENIYKGFFVIGICDYYYIKEVY